MSADRPHVAENRRGDAARSMSYNRIVAIDDWVFDNVSQCYRGPNYQPLPSISSHLIQLRNTHHGNYSARRLLATFHVWIEIGAAGDELPLGPGAGHDLYRLRDFARAAVVKFGQSHHVVLFSTLEKISKACRRPFL